jgi:predicted PurR-regulated permease PerM
LASVQRCTKNVPSEGRVPGAVELELELYSVLVMRADRDVGRADVSRAIKAVFGIRNASQRAPLAERVADVTAEESQGDHRMRTEDNALLFLVIALSLAFAWIVWPFYGALLWGTVAAVLFAPLYRRLAKAMGQRRNLAALSVVIIVVTIVILPAALIGASLAQEASGVYARMQSGELDFARSFQQAADALPAWAKNLLDRFGLASLSAVQEKALASLTKGSKFVAEQAFSVGMSTFDFIVNLLVMLYLLFFLLRDEAALFTRIRRAIPLRAEQKQALLLKFAVVIRATVKGDLLVSLLQGALGGLIFWFLGIGAPLL